MPRPTVIEEIAAILKNRGYDNGIEPAIFNELLVELAEMVYRRKGDF